MNISSPNLEARLLLDERDSSNTARRGSDSDTFRPWIAIPLFSAVLLIPCFWQSRIQAGDLSSHIYNAWLAIQIHRGTLPGLWISPQSNNVLFDVILEWLFVHLGPGAAQRIAVSLSVLIFGWGAMLFISRVAGKNWWFSAPCVAMLSFASVFCIGFFNFYLSSGLCLWYLAITWDKRWQIQALASPLLLLAWIAHPFPVVWAVGIAAYATLAKSRSVIGRALLLALGIATLILLRYTLIHRYRCTWSMQQVFFLTGANQISVFNASYSIPFAGLLFIWLRQLRQLIKTQGLARILSTAPFQLWLLNAAAVALIPNQIMFPQFTLPFGYITTRLSLEAAILMCAVLAAVPLAKLDKITLLAIALLFFGFLYRDERSLNHLENRLDAAIQALPPMRRVIAQAPEQSLYWLCFQHDVDRACIGRCFSYGNYEPSSRQFRIHAGPDNGVVMSDQTDVDAVRTGRYTVRARDLPMQLVYPCGAGFGYVCSQALGLGEISGKP